nr:MAG TPA: tail repeat-like protein [Caudoviricetes sp.]
MKFLDQSGLVIVQSWINNSFAKVDQAFGTISYAGNISGITVSQVSTTTNGSPSTVYYDTTGGQFVLKAGNNVYYNNWPNKYVWVVPGINEPWGGVIYKDLSSNKLYKYLPEDASMTACDITDYPAMRLRDLLADIEMYIAQKGMYAPSQHTHSIANVTGLQAKLDTINKGLTVLGLGQWGAVKVDGVLTNSINAAQGGVGNPTAIYIAQSISTPSGTISGIVGKIGSAYYTTWSGTSVPTNLYMKTNGSPYYSKYYYTMGSNGLPNAVYRWNGQKFTIDEDYSDHSISDGFGKDLEDAIQPALDYIDTVSAESVSRTDAVTHSAISSTSSTVRLAYVLSSASTHGNIKNASASELGLVNGVSSSGTGNVVTSMSKAADSSSITQNKAWVEPWTVNAYQKQSSATARISATEGKFSVLDFRSGSGMYLGFASPYGLTNGMNHHWKGLIMKKANQPINIAKPSMLSSSSVILCNLPQTQIVSGTNFYFDAYTTTNTTSTSHDTLVLILYPVTNVLEFSA